MTEADDKLVANERAKLTATWLNAISVAAIAVGGIGPLVGVFTGTVRTGPALALTAAWFAFGVVLHSLARRRLGGLRA